MVIYDYLTLSKRKMQVCEERLRWYQREKRDMEGKCEKWCHHFSLLLTSNVSYQRLDPSNVINTRSSH